MNLSVDIVGVPIFDPVTTQLPLPAGLPRVLELNAVFAQHGEWVGEMVVTARYLDSSGVVDSVRLPIYAKCAGVLGQKVLTMRRLNTAPSDGRRGSAPALWGPMPSVAASTIGRTGLGSAGLAAPAGALSLSRSSSLSGPPGLPLPAPVAAGV